MNTRKIAGTGIFAALTIVFTVISNYVQIGGISINLSVIPIAFSGILYGPLAGFIVGLINGGLIMTAPSTIALFFPACAYGTVIICLVKSSIAGMMAGFIYKWISKKNDFWGMVIAALATPIINTGIFIGLSFAFYSDILEKFFTIYLLFNFLFEFGFTLLSSPFIAKGIIHYKKNSKNKLDA